MRTKRLALALMVGGLLLFGGLALFAQTQNSIVTGVIKDNADTPVRDATVLLNSESQNVHLQTKTDAYGTYRFNDVAPAQDYELQAQVAGSDIYAYPRLVEVAVYEPRVVVPDFVLPITLSSATSPAPPPPPPPTGKPSTATINGWVHDDHDAPIEGARVVLNEKAGASREQSTDATGKYTFADVPLSRAYTVEASAAGFNQKLSKHVRVLASTSTVQVPFTFVPTGVRPDVLSNTLGGGVDSEAVHTLPLRNRDFLDLALLTPGAYPVEQGSVLEGASIVVNGARADMNNFLLDGADDNDYTINQSLPFQLVEAMDQFRVQASTSPAEFGRSGGAQVNTISRRGLSQAHGTLFEFNRSSALSAGNFFSVYNGGTFDYYVRASSLYGDPDPLSVPILAALDNRRNPQVVQNQFGGNLGGALKKDKLFGFFNYEGFRISNPRPLFERVPSLVIRSAAACGQLYGSPCNGVALALNNLYPVPNVPLTTINSNASSGGAKGNVPPTPYTVTDPMDGPAFFVGESANGTSTDNYLGRMDWQKTERAAMGFKYNAQDIGQTQGGTLPKTSSYPGNGIDVRGRNQNFTYNYVQQFSKTSNELRLAWNRFRLDALAQDRTIDPASLGFQNLDFNDQGLPTILAGGVSANYGSSLPPYADLGAPLNAPSSRADNVWSASDNVTRISGRHDWKAGGEFRYIRLDVDNSAFGRGALGFQTGGFVADTGLPDVASIARVDPAFGGGFDRSFRTKSLDWFVQDQWRFRTTFTVNYGVRYELNTAPVEAQNRLVNYYPALGGLVQAGNKTIYDPLGNVIGTAASAAPRAGFQTDANNFSPRLGFAWNPHHSRTVIRGGYALVFDQQPLQPSVNMLLNPPIVMEDFAPIAVVNPAGALALNSNDFLGQTFQFGQPDLTSTNDWFRIPYSITARDPSSHTPYVHQLNFGIERQLTHRMVFEANYVGSAGRRLPRLRDISPCTTQAFLIDSCSAPAEFPTILNQENTANSIFNSLQLHFRARVSDRLYVAGHYEWAKSIDNASSMLPQVLVLPPSYADYFTDLATSSTPPPGLPSLIQQTYGSAPGLPIGVNPEDLAALNNVSPTLSLQPALPTISTAPRLPQDSRNLHGERGPSDFDVRQQLALDYTYGLPSVGRVGALGRGWELAGITTVRTGQPYTVFADYFGTPLRPNLLGSAVANNQNPNAAINGGLPAILSGFAVSGGNPPGSFGMNFNRVSNQSETVLLPGNLGRNTFTGPGLVNFDVSILKNTHLGSERKELQFRAEFFNLFNNVNFRQPYSRAGVVFNDPSLGAVGFADPFFGQILQAFPARQIQFALKLIF